MSGGEKKPSFPAAYKAHPDYADGYGEGLSGRCVDTGRAAKSEPYSYGYEAGSRAAKLLREHGFSQCKDGFEVRFLARGEVHP